MLTNKLPKYDRYLKYEFFSARYRQRIPNIKLTIEKKLEINVRNGPEPKR
jgi:hypothetical protein